MKKYAKISLAIGALVIVTGIFWLLQFSGEGKNKITLENNHETDDTLSKGQPEDTNAEIVAEPGNFPEKDEGEAKEQPAQSEPGKNIVDTQKTEESPGKKNSPSIINKLVSWGFEKSSGRKIDTIIIHSSYDAIGSEHFDLGGLISEYKSYGVSPHYLIDREGTIYRLVEDKNIAYHAGVSQTPDGRSGVNGFSIGVELMNTKSGNFTVGQYVSINSLVNYLKGKYEIKYVLGHNQIAPGRKDDPWNFDWKKME